MKKETKGITLIALVVTIIVLLILAGIAITLSVGENGLFTRASNARKEHEIAEVLEKLEMEKESALIDKNGNLTIKDYLDHLKNEGIITDEDIEDAENENSKTIIVDDVTFLVEEDDGNIEITYDGALNWEDDIPPEITIEVDQTTNYINGKVKAKVKLKDNKSGIRYSKSKWVINDKEEPLGEDLSLYTGGKLSKAEVEIESDKKTATGTYYIHVIATDKAGNTNEEVASAEIKTGYAISNSQELQNMKNDLAGHYYVINDFDMTGFNFTMIAGDFTGTLDGQGHTISHFTLSNSKTGIHGSVAMFDCLQKNARICNLLMKDVNISSNGYHVAVFATRCLESVYNYSRDIVFEKVGITGVISGQGQVATFVGGTSAGDVEFGMLFKSCYARTNLSSSGGYDASSFTVFDNQRHKGVVRVENCYWSGTNDGSGRTGSFVTPGSVDNNNNQLIDSKITISNSYYDKEKFPLKLPNNVSAVGKGLITKEMKTQESYIGWDFDNTWFMGEDGYPELKFE